MAKADGVVTWDEVVAFEEVVNVPAHETQNVRRFFDQARQAVAGYESYAKQLANLFKDKPGVLEDVLDAPQRLRHRMQSATVGTSARQCDVHGLLIERLG